MKNLKEPKTVLCTLLLMIVVLFPSCFLVPNSSVTNATRIQFEVDVSEANRLADRTPRIPTIEKIIGIDIAAESPRFIYKEYTDGINFIDVPKKGIYLLGLFGTGGAKSISGSRDISSAISLIGNIKIASNGLDSLPVTESAAAEINLETLSYNQDSGSYNSDISDAELSEQAGTDQELLSAFGTFDDVIKKFLNPDINGNGKLDTDENLEWALNSEYLFSYNEAYINMESGEVSAAIEDFFVPARKLIYFRAVSGFGSLPSDLTQVRLIFPNTVTVIDGDGQPISYINPRLLQVNSPVYQFDLTSIQEPTPFFSGNYSLQIGSETYFFMNISFVNPDAAYEGMIFPIFDYLDNGSIFTTLRYRWKFIENGTIRDALPEEIAMMVSYANFEFVDNYPVHTFQIYDLSSVSGEIDITDRSISLSSFKAPGMSIRDLSQNQYQFWYDFQG